MCRENRDDRLHFILSYHLESCEKKMSPSMCHSNTMVNDINTFLVTELKQMHYIYRN